MVTRAWRAVVRVLFHDPEVVRAEKRLLVLLVVRVATWLGAGAGLAELLNALS
jgi:hypothetical protein